MILWMLALAPGIEEHVGLGVTMGVTTGEINTKSNYLQSLTSLWFITVSKLMNWQVTSEYTDDTWMAKFVVTFPELAAWVASDLYDVELNGDNPENLSVYMQRSRGGTSLTNLVYWR